MASHIAPNKFAVPIKMGLLIALFKIILSTVQYQFFTTSFTNSSLFMIAGFIVTMLLLVVTGNMQRKTLGGYIEIKEAFQAIFIAILIFIILSDVYDIIYIKIIDPTMMERAKEASMAWAEKMGAPQNTLDDMEKQFDEQSNNSLNIGKQLLQVLQHIVIYSIFGLICAAIVRKKRPEHAA